MPREQRAAALGLEAAPELFTSEPSSEPFFFCIRVTALGSDGGDFFSNHLFSIAFLKAVCVCGDTKIYHQELDFSFDEGKKKLTELRPAYEKNI